MSELKPCPFCGGKPECYRTVVDTEHGYSDAAAVRCLACNARTSLILFDARKHPNGEEYEDAEKLWNRGAVARIDCAEHKRLDNESLLRGEKCDENYIDHCLSNSLRRSNHG